MIGDPVRPWELLFASKHMRVLNCCEEYIDILLMLGTLSYRQPFRGFIRMMDMKRDQQHGSSI